MFNLFLQNQQETAASSSGSKLRSFFIGMGFLPGVVDKVIEENGTLCVSKML
jgi:membrane-associated protease RseP (regulator of RpoE activity)